MVALPRAHVLCRRVRGRNGARREAQAPGAADRPPAADLARRVQPRRPVGRERRVGQLGPRVGRAHRQIRRDAARTYRGRIPAGVERGLEAARQREQGQHAQGEFEVFFPALSPVYCTAWLEESLPLRKRRGRRVALDVPSGVGEAPSLASCASLFLGTSSWNVARTVC